MIVHDPEEIARRVRYIGITPTFVFSCLTITMMFFPLLLALTAFIFQTLICILNLIAASRGRYRHIPSVSDAGYSVEPVFSVHVPTHNEPPDVVIRTLEALLAQIKAPTYEVLVIDNNTSDPILWKPVEMWCENYVAFRFIHCTGVKGAKAGALNIALSHTRSDTTHIVVIDADYCVFPDFLASAASELTIRDVDFLQYPQAYVENGDSCRGIVLELADYFDRHAKAANTAGAMLLTGTLSVISLSALAAVGGWSSRTSTEDAELGLRLGEAGYRGAFVNKIFGRGMLPLTLASLQQQRRRWASGNIRTFACWVSDQLQGNEKRSFRATAIRTALIASQLTAWNNFALPALIALLVALVHNAFFPSMAAEVVADLSVLTIALTVITAILPIFLLNYRAEQGLFVALCSRVSMLPTAAIATVEGLYSRRQIFIVTPKALSDDNIEGSICSVNGVSAFFGLGLIFLAPLHHSPIACIGAFALFLPWLASGFVSRALSANRPMHCNEDR